MKERLMNNKAAHAKKGFTLIELIVVIGIIGILAGVLFSSFGGATDSARAAQCLSNMRGLAQAANAYGMKSSYFPLAGSRESVDINPDGDKVSTVYKPQYGWISWLDAGAYDDGHGNRTASGHRSGNICPFYGTGSTKDDTYAITNGTLWIACAQNRKLYTCPEHVRYRARKHKPTPLWSYVMNSKFGYDYSMGSRAIATDQSLGIWYTGLSRSDRVLLFAELPTVDPETGSDVDDGNEYAADCTLQYKGTVNGKSYKTSEWSGPAESIGFPHRNGKRGYCGHVAFADGHCEKLLYSNKGLSIDKLTTILCEGLDVAYTPANGYQLPADADEMN